MFLLLLIGLFFIIYGISIKASRVLKAIIIISSLGILVATGFMHFNQFYKEETKTAIGVITYVVEKKISYEFNLNNKKFENTVNITSENFSVGEPVVIRYLVNDCNVNTINSYNFIFFKESIILGLSFLGLTLGFALSIFNVFISKYSKEINELFLFIQAKQFFIIHTFVAIIAFALFMCGVAAVILQDEAWVIGIGFAVVGLIFIINYIFVCLKTFKR